MTIKRIVGLVTVALVCSQAAAPAVELAEGLTLNLSNRLRIQWDDNVRSAPDDKEDSFKIMNAVEMGLNMNRPQTYMSLRYRPSFTWWENREEDDTDLHHLFNAVLDHTFSPRFSISLTDKLLYDELPELIEDGAVVREKNDYFYNTFNGTFSITLRPETFLDLKGSHRYLEYDEKQVGSREDYEALIGGLDVRHQLNPSTSLAGQFRYEVFDYESELSRDFDSWQAGMRAEYSFSRNLMANLSAGYTYKEYDDAVASDETRPYGEAALTYLISPQTRFSGGLSHSMTETDVYPFSDQTRTSGFASMAWDLTSRFAWYVSGSYTVGKYKGDSLPANATVGDLPAKIVAGFPEGVSLDAPLTQEYIDSLDDKEEDILQFSTRLTYRLNRKNWLEAGWQYTDVSTDFRDDYERNRLHVGWRARL